LEEIPMSESWMIAPDAAPRAAVSSQSPDGHNDEVVDWGDLGQRMWHFLTGRQAAIHYTFDDLRVEVPRDTGTQAPRATWRLSGTVTVTSSDRATSA
jgi:hypothetical protein